MTYFSGTVAPVFVRMEAAPVTTSSTTLAAPYDMMVYTNTSTTAAQTLVLPVKPVDGQMVYVCNNAAITALTLTADSSVSATVAGAPNGLSVGQGLVLMFSSAQNAWFTVKA